ncbi:MAG: hypothetical protein HOQ05_11365, partial [Corynebacteriales bacterium]|nr:hypothetical protein [Mycobacteriales bacterium]
MTRVALVTCAEYPELDGAAESRGIAALRARGIDAQPVVWTDSSVSWSSFDAVVIRSTWDYVENPEAFLEWASSVPKLFNPHPVLKWNADKRYLLELAEAGVPIVPTVLVEPGQDCEFGDSGEFVIKPTVGIGALGVCRFDATFDQQRGLARVHAQQLLDAGLGVLVQPYQRGIEMYGETSLIYLGGSFS